MDIDLILQPWQRFGVHLGLERMQKLLADLGHPHLAMPIIHVTGSNGKGSVCAYLTSVLTAAGYQVGRYTSPHLVGWHERISINQVSIANQDLVEVLQKVQAAIPSDVVDSPTQFEVITAAAWLYFAQAQELYRLPQRNPGAGGRGGRGRFKIRQQGASPKTRPATAALVLRCSVAVVGSRFARIRYPRQKPTWGFA